MSLFGRIMKDVFESNAGRIRWNRNMWALVGSRWDKRRIRNTAMIGSSRVNDLGEFISDGRVLVAKPHARCPHAPGDDFYFDGKWFWVPAVECRKCPHHRESTRKFRFPRCVFGRSESVREVATQSLTEFGGMLRDATQQANEMLGGHVIDSCPTCPTTSTIGSQNSR